MVFITSTADVTAEPVGTPSEGSRCQRGYYRNWPSGVDLRASRYNGVRSTTIDNDRGQFRDRERADGGNKRGKKKRPPKVAKKDRAPGKTTAADQSPSAAEIRTKEQAARDRELNRQRQAALAERESLAQIRQLIETNRIDPFATLNDEPRDEPVDYNFSDGGVVRRLSLSKNLHRRVTVGTLAIAKLAEDYHVIGREVAEKIAERDGSFIVVLNDDTNTEPDEDDPYAAFEVPDDLMW